QRDKEKTNLIAKLDDDIKEIKQEQIAINLSVQGDTSIPKSPINSESQNAHVTESSNSNGASNIKPIMFEAKPDPELIIKSVLEYFTYLKFRNSFRGIDNYSFVSPQPWSSPCPICNGKHGNYGLHGKWNRNGTEYCLTYNSSSNELKFLIVA
ncbi:4749_t:CDS:2, partial [Dentiscutata heterogama]